MPGGGGGTMPSENKTVNYGLNQWQGNEYPKRQDFVDDNATIDAQMKKNEDAAAAKIPKSLATASDQVLVSSGVGAWIVKTLAQFKSWLGLGSAAYNDESDFETPAGAQTKVDTALSVANGYTDGAVDALAGEGNTKTVKQLDDEVETHLSETANLVDATNTNNYVFDTGSNITLHDLQILTFTVVNASTGNVTIKVDNNAAVPLYKQGTAINAPVKSYKPFRAWYSSYSNCFFMIASAEGDAVAADVLAGKTFSNDNDTGITGTLVLSGTASDSDILLGKTYYNTDAKTKRTGSMANQGQKIITPSTVNQAIPAGYHNGSGYVVGNGNLVESNIKRGVNIFGKIGTYPPITAGDDIELIRDTSKHATQSETCVTVKSATIHFNGSVYVSMGFYDDSEGIDAYGIIMKNGVTIVDGWSNGNDIKYIGSNISVADGDIISWGLASDSSGYFAYTNSLYMSIAYPITYIDGLVTVN